jgi:mannose-6-phosphate isomerase-like protein (cupin superfamily)
MSSDYAVVHADEVEDPYADTDVPGEFRSLTRALGCEQVAVTLIRVPPHSDFEQGTGHYHEAQEELYVIARGTLTMRFGDEVRKVGAGSVARVAPRTPRSHRNEGDEPVEMWAVSRRLDRSDAVKLDDFWEASPDAAQVQRDTPSPPTGS